MMKSLLFVCTGNICRSPTADAIMRAHSQKNALEFHIDSAGTHSYHIGEAPDPRTVSAALKYGIDMSKLRARQLQEEDFEKFDYLFAMDENHLQIMQSLCPDPYLHKLHLFLDWSKDRQGQDVPDPYYGDKQGFDDVFRLVESCCDDIISSIEKSS